MLCTHSSASSHHVTVAYVYKMTTTSNSLGTSLPVPSAPPSKIFADSSNEDVKLWVYYCLRENDDYLNENEAWALARKVKGRGQVVLYYNKESWESQVPGWGETIYISLQQSQKYVVSGNKTLLSTYLNYYYLDGHNLRIWLGRSNNTTPRGWMQWASSNYRKRKLPTNKKYRNRLRCIHFLPPSLTISPFEQVGSRKQETSRVPQAQTKRGPELLERLRRHP